MSPRADIGLHCAQARLLLVLAALAALFAQTNAVATITIAADASTLEFHGQVSVILPVVVILYQRVLLASVLLSRVRCSEHTV